MSPSARQQHDRRDRSPCSPGNSVVSPKFLCVWRRLGACIARQTRRMPGRRSTEREPARRVRGVAPNAGTWGATPVRIVDGTLAGYLREGGSERYAAPCFATIPQSQDQGPGDDSAGDSLASSNASSLARHPIEVVAVSSPADRFRAPRRDRLPRRETRPSVAEADTVVVAYLDLLTKLRESGAELLCRGVDQGQRIRPTPA